MDVYQNDNKYVSKDCFSWNDKQTTLIKCCGDNAVWIIVVGEIIYYLVKMLL